MSRHGLSIGDHLLAWLAIGYLRTTARIPVSWARGITIALGRLALRALPRLHRIGMDNLNLAYGDTISAEEKRRILRGAMDNLAITAAEFSRLPSLRGDASSDWVEIVGAENVDTTRSGILIGGHHSNWELMATCVPRYGIHMAVVVRPLKHPALNAAIDNIRRAASSDTVPKEGAGPEVTRRLKEGQFVGVLIDQSPRESAVPVTFFGQPCWATIAPVMLALRSKAPIVTALLSRKPDGRYLLEALPPIHLTRTGDLRRDLVENSQRLQDVFEAHVRKYPEQWLWFHRRWKARPQLQEEWDARAARGQRDN